MVDLPASKGKNLQIQMAVNTGIGVVHSASQRGSIRMNVTANFAAETLLKAFSSEHYNTNYQGKKLC